MEKIGWQHEWDVARFPPGFAMFCCCIVVFACLVALDFAVETKAYRRSLVEVLL